MNAQQHGEMANFNRSRRQVRYLPAVGTALLVVGASGGPNPTNRWHSMTC